MILISYLIIKLFQIVESYDFIKFIQIMIITILLYINGDSKKYIKFLYCCSVL